MKILYFFIGLYFTLFLSFAWYVRAEFKEDHVDPEVLATYDNYGVYKELPHAKAYCRQTDYLVRLHKIYERENRKRLFNPTGNHSDLTKLEADIEKTYSKIEISGGQILADGLELPSGEDCKYIW